MHALFDQLNFLIFLWEVIKFYEILIIWKNDYEIYLILYVHVHTIFWYGHAFLLNKVILLFSFITLNSSEWNSFVRFQSHHIKSASKMDINL